MPSVSTPPLEGPASDYFNYFFLRSKANGCVAMKPPGSSHVYSQPMLAHDRSAQILSPVAVSGDPAHAMLVFKAGDALDLQMDASGQMYLVHNSPDPLSMTQRWAFTADDQLVNASAPGKALTQNSFGWGGS